MHHFQCRNRWTLVWCGSARCPRQSWSHRNFYISKTWLHSRPSPIRSLWLNGLWNPSWHHNLSEFFCWASPRLLSQFKKVNVSQIPDCLAHSEYHVCKWWNQWEPQNLRLSGPLLWSLSSLKPHWLLHNIQDLYSKIFILWRGQDICCNPNSSSQVSSLGTERTTLTGSWNFRWINHLGEASLLCNLH